MFEETLKDNKITMSLAEYLKITNEVKEVKDKYIKLIEYLYNKGLETDSDDEIVFYRYNLSDDYMKKLLEELDIERFNRASERLKEGE